MIGYRGVTLGAPVVAVVLTLELGMIVLLDVADLPATLATLTDRAREYRRPLPDLVAYLADRVEPRGHDSAYLGVAVSSIDVAREGHDPMPWDGLAHLVDGTRITLHATRPELTPQARSTHTLAHLGPVWAQHTPA